ncbi:MAG: hypothetical protein J6T92_00235 [Ottowia sp.]|nr:hypothetical protein [Ottowia sp.]
MGDTTVAVVYTGRERPFIDRIYGTRLDWMPGQSRALSPELAARFLRHKDCFKQGKARAAQEAKPTVDDTKQKLQESDKREEEQREEQDGKFALIEELKQMDAAALKAWAKAHTGETFKGNPSLATIQQRVFDWVEQFGVPA